MKLHTENVFEGKVERRIMGTGKKLHQKYIFSSISSSAQWRCYFGSRSPPPSLPPPSPPAPTPAPHPPSPTNPPSPSPFSPSPHPRKILLAILFPHFPLRLPFLPPPTVHNVNRRKMLRESVKADTFVSFRRML